MTMLSMFACAVIFTRLGICWLALYQPRFAWFASVVKFDSVAMFGVLNGVTLMSALTHLTIGKKSSLATSSNNAHTRSLRSTCSLI